MPDLNRYEFRSVWTVRASPDEAYDVLRDPVDYPSWWPEVRAVRRLDEGLYRVTVRALLPYELVFTGRQTTLDPVARVLELSMSGDLEGFSRWTIEGAPGDASTLVFEERVVAHKPLLRRLAALGRPAFRINHAVMMRRGEAGLRTYLAGFRRGRRPPPEPR